MVVGSKLGLAFVRALLAIAAVSVDGRFGLLVAAQVLSLLAEAWRGATVARKRLGYPLASDQRVRLSLWYTVTTGVVGVAFLMAVTFGKMFKAIPVLQQWSLVAMVADRLAGRGLAVTIGALVAFHVALVLLRYLLLSLFNPRR
jgi:hypothetical protein